MSNLVSIVVNCYNGDKYLKKNLESIQKQKYKNWELIFWDNQSTDNSKKIFESFKETRFKYFYSEKHTTIVVVPHTTTSCFSAKKMNF